MLEIKNNYINWMLKFIIPAIVIFLLVLFWEKISKIIYKKFNIKFNYVLICATLLIIAAIYLLIKN
jgi:uncharacterized membrane protein YoaK (UPF0700 family)